MNYQKIYDSIIERAKIRILKGYKESHHIIPSCMGGNDKKVNRVNLTAKEHYLIHFLLTKIYPDNHKLIFAFWQMCNGSKKDRPNTNAKMYEIAREMFSKAMKGRPSPNLGKKASKEVCEKRSQMFKGHKVSKKTRDLFIQRTKDNPSKATPIYQLDKNTLEIIAEFKSMRDAWRQTGIHYNGIRQVFDGKAKTAGGFKWIHKNPEDKDKFKTKNKK